MRGLFLEIAQRVVGRPTVPYHESAVREVIEEIAAEHALDVRLDAFGNIYLQVGEAGRPIVLAAHMDHPGFEFLPQAEPNKYSARFLGGVPASYFKPGVPLRVYPGNLPAVLGAQSEEIHHIELSAQGSERPQFAIWDLVDYQRIDDQIFARACDDLIGVATILCVLIELKREEFDGQAIGLISRAEEVGFHGALFAATTGEIPKDALVISLETSREMPPVQTGNGVIIRVGDRASIFDSEATRYLFEVGELAKKEFEGFNFQRALMSGGTCEATAYQAHGFQTTAVCVALRNYHNCGSANRIEAESVSVGDCISMGQLLIRAAKQMENYAALTGKLGERLGKLLAEAQARQANR